MILVLVLTFEVLAILNILELRCRGEKKLVLYIIVVKFYAVGVVIFFWDFYK